MRKEVIFIIFSGVFLGLVVAYGFWRANSSLKPNSKSISDIQTQQNQANSQEEFILSIAEPKENEVITQDKANVSGITRPKAWVTISAEEEDYILQANESGVFDQEVKLIGGVNQLIIHSLDEHGDKNEHTLTLVYSSEFAKDLED